MVTQATSSSSFSTSSSSSSSCPRWKYDVFLSFCGVDTRKNFTDHLYTALKQKGIITFRDDEKLERGTYISQELMKAIEESKYAIIILSTNYASSRWCLIELAKIVECMKKTYLTVLPVFYHVDPSDVRNQSGTLVEAFTKHEEDTRVNTKDVQVWKAALKDIGHISGWHLHDRHESIVIQEILKRIFSKLNLIFQSTVSKDLVGIESRMKEMLDLYLDEGLGGVRFVGICGMGGIGKTTIAQEIFKRISSNFEASSFIANVKEETKNQRLVSLQTQLLSKILMESEIKIWNVSEGISVIANKLCNKKVLIVLDDVDGEEQLEALAGKHDWFGVGSQIIVTSRDIHLLRRHGMDDVYTPKGLNDDEALELFSWRAFKKPHPEENYADLSRDFVSYANGLPLALSILGSSLFGKRTDAWRSACDKLRAESNRDILNILQISFDGLMDTQKELFLDIACFFKGEKKDCIRDILESFGYHPDYNIDVLRDKFLITIDEHGTLWMHDLLQKMGQEIVHRESPKEPGGRSRLWIYEDVVRALKNNIGTEVVEGIKLNVPFQKVEHLSAEAFSKMKNLRLLEIGDVQPQHSLFRGNVQLPNGLSYLSNELRFIKWHGYPLKSMPTDFQPNKLVELRMTGSFIKQLWKGIMNLNELRLIDLSWSQNLIEMPDLSGAPKLKQLILSYCTRLYKIHASLGDLKQLIRLQMNDCKSLESLPQKISSEALEIFSLSGCSRLKKFPEIVGNMPRLMSLKTLYLSDCSKLNELPESLGNIEGLETLDVSGTAITRLPSSFVHLKNLQLLMLNGCKGLSSISSNKLFRFPLIRKKRKDPTGMLGRSLSNLCSLTYLYLSYCNLWSIPEGIGCLSSLKHLHLEGNNFVRLPKSIARLSNLTWLYVGGCTRLRTLPGLPLNIEFIDACGCTSLEILLRPENGPYPDLKLLNCVRLINYGDILLTTLRHNIQFKGDEVYKIAIPGGEIPKWFINQSVGNSMNLQVPSDLCKNLMGVAVCAVFVSPQNPSPHEYRSVGYYLEVNGCYTGPSIGFSSWERFGKIELHHLFQGYLPCKKMGRSWNENLSQTNADGFIQIEIEFETTCIELEVTKCGVRLIFEQDVEDLNRTMPVCSSSSITPYEDDFKDLAKDTKTKRNRDDYDRDEAGTSGEGTSNEVDVPHPKRIKLPNLIERLIPRLGNWVGNFSKQGQGNCDCKKEESQ